MKRYFKVVYAKSKNNKWKIVEGSKAIFTTDKSLAEKIFKTYKPNHQVLRVEKI